MGNTITLEEEITLKSIYEEISNKYRVDGEDEKYATYYEDLREYKAILGYDADEYEEFSERIMEEFDYEVIGWDYPVIAFDDANAINGGWIFDSAEEAEEIHRIANKFFEKK